MLTEGVTWVMTGIGIGMALGAFAAGWVVDNFGAQNGFWVSVVAGADRARNRAPRPEDACRAAGTVSGGGVGATCGVSDLAIQAPVHIGRSLVIERSSAAHGMLSIAGLDPAAVRSIMAA